MAKQVVIISSHNGRKTVYVGSMEYMLNDVFGYTLECGHSWNHKINKNPKNQASLVKALNQSAEECHSYSDYYDGGSIKDLAIYETKGWNIEREAA